jgi:hypothetical protein
MHYSEFITALDGVADMFFNEEYDKKNPSFNGSSKPTEEKRFFMYKYLRCGNPNYIQNVRKSYGRAFSSSIEANERIPDNDISKRYKYKNNTAKIR